MVLRLLKKEEYLEKPRTKDQAEQEKKQLTDLQQKTQKIISAVKEGAVIQKDSVVDNRKQNTFYKDNKEGKHKGVWISIRCKVTWKKY